MTNKKDLPDWLSDFIYKELGGYYSPDRIAAQNNLLSTEEENKRYLGTYFPRSFTESYCIFSNLFENDAYVETVNGKDRLSILSFGCGTGGDLMGLLEAISEKLPWIKELEIVAYDGNFNAVTILKDIIEHPANTGRFRLKIDYSPFAMNGNEDFNLCCRCLTQPFDLVCSLKMVNELYRHDVLPSKPFLRFLNGIAPKLATNGVMICVDAPVKVKGDYMPVFLSAGLRDFLRLHDEFEVIVPIPCHYKGRQCNGRCYMNKVFFGDIFNSEMVTYCMLARKDLAKAVIPALEACKYKINHDGDCCKMVNGEKTLDAYDIKTG